MTAHAHDQHRRPGTQQPASASRAKSEPLEPSLRAYFEPLLGHDLSQVRVHAETSGPESLGAAAVTVGNDVSFGPGWYAPETPRGRRLLAHELTHVVQQAGSTGPSTGV